MPLSAALMRHATFPRRIAWSSAIIGVVFFVLFTSILLNLTWHHREKQHHQLLVNSRDALQHSLTTLIDNTLNPLLPFSHANCHAINRELTSRAAFAGNLRAILLVKDGNAFCSSATGSFFLPLNIISAQTDPARDTDLQLLSGTPLQPSKPAVAIWLKNPGSTQSGVFATLNLSLEPYQLLASYHPEISGMALEAQNSAITSWQQVVTKNDDLPPSLMQLQLSGFPLQFVLYGSTLSRSDYQFIFLSGTLLSLLVGGVCWLLFSLCKQPGKEILQGIKRGEFHVEYQPLITSYNGQPYGAEALLRWTHPTEGAIPPDVFINYAETQNLIIPLTRHLFQLVARDAHLLSIKIAIDDFGTGHSALIYLERYAFDYLKIDRGFVQSIGTETVTSPVLDTVLQLAKQLKMKTVAEGVETGDQAAWLINRGVTHLQGYIFSRPLRPEPLIDYFELHSA